MKHAISNHDATITITITMTITRTTTTITIISCVSTLSVSSSSSSIFTFDLYLLLLSRLLDLYFCLDFSLDLIDAFDFLLLSLFFFFFLRLCLSSSSSSSSEEEEEEDESCWSVPFFVLFCSSFFSCPSPNNAWHSSGFEDTKADRLRPSPLGSICSCSRLFCALFFNTTRRSELIRRFTVVFNSVILECFLGSFWILIVNTIRIA